MSFFGTQFVLWYFHLLILVIAIQLWSFSLHIFVKTVGNHKTAAYFIDYHRYMFACSFRDKGLIIIRRGEGGLCWLELAYRSENDYCIGAGPEDTCIILYYCNHLQNCCCCIPASIMAAAKSSPPAAGFISWWW